MGLTTTRMNAIGAILETRSKEVPEPVKGTPKQSDMTKPADVHTSTRDPEKRFGSDTRTTLRNHSKELVKEKVWRRPGKKK